MGQDTTFQVAILTRMGTALIEITADSCILKGCSLRRIQGLPVKDAQNGLKGMQAANKELQKALSESINQGGANISKLVDEINASNKYIKQLVDAKTKSAAAVLKAFKADAAKVLIAVKEYEENQLRATGNLPLAILIKAASVNTYQVVYSDKLMFTKEALDEFVKRLA